MIRFTILGEPASKANSRELLRIGRMTVRETCSCCGAPTRNGRYADHSGKALLAKSPKARDYERDALLQIPPFARARLQGPVRATLKVFYASERPDLDESVILDVLQDRYSGKGEARELVQRGVYCNDRQVREKHVFHAIDKRNPRAEIEVEELSPGLAFHVEHSTPEPVGVPF